jgi:hypothetical protein
MQTKINFLDRKCASRWHQRCQLIEAGTSVGRRFFAQLSGKLPPATIYASVVLKSKHKGRVENLVCAGTRCLRLTDRKLLSKAIAIENDLRGTGHQSQSGGESTYRAKLCRVAQSFDR